MLGVQIVITMVVASIMSKVGPYLSFARWMLSSSGLVRYVHPSDEELKELALIPKPEKKKNKNRVSCERRNASRIMPKRSKLVPTIRKPDLCPAFEWPPFCFYHLKAGLKFF